MRRILMSLCSFVLMIAVVVTMTACGKEASYYKSEEFQSLSGYDKLYYYVTHEGVSERELPNEYKKLSDAITSSEDDFVKAWKYSSGSYTIRYAKLLDAIVLRVILDKSATKPSFEIFIKNDGEPYEFSSTILYKDENIECASTGVVPFKFSRSTSLELLTLSGVEDKYETYKQDSHNACAILMLNVNNKIKNFGFNLGNLGFYEY